VNDEEISQQVPASAWIYPTLIHGVLALALFTRLTSAGASHGRTFAEYNMGLPAATEVFVTAATRLESCNIPMVLVLSIGLLSLDAAILWLLGGWKRFEGIMWFCTVIVLLFIIWGLMEGTFLMADYKLREGLSRRAR
jgi:hypothetical protein